MIDLFLLLVIGVVTWCVASEGPWGAAFTLLTVLLSGMIAMNYFEPAAVMIDKSFNLPGDWKYRSDFIAMMSLFTISVFALRASTDYLHPVFIPVHSLLHDGLRWLCAFLAGYVTMAIILTSLHTAFLPREFLGFTPERNNLLGISAPDRQWLGFVQYLSENAYSKGKNGPIFDGPLFAVVPGQPPQVWSSFPIRYAYRRDMLFGGKVASATPTMPQDGGMQPVSRRPTPGSGF